MRLEAVEMESIKILERPMSLAKKFTTDLEVNEEH